MLRELLWKLEDMVNAFIIPVLFTSIIVLMTIPFIIIYNGEKQTGNVQDKTVVEKPEFTWSELN